MTIFVASVAVALSISFLCSLMEAALLSLTPSQVAKLSARYPGIGAIWRGFKAAGIEIPYPQRMLHLADAVNIKMDSP